MQRRLSATALLYSSCVCLFSESVFLCEGNKNRLTPDSYFWCENLDAFGFFFPVTDSSFPPVPETSFCLG